MPGMTPASGFPMMWAASGLPLPQLVDRIIQTALRKRPGLRLAVPARVHAAERRTVLPAARALARAVLMIVARKGKRSSERSSPCRGRLMNNPASLAHDPQRDRPDAVQVLQRDDVHRVPEPPWSRTAAGIW